MFTEERKESLFSWSMIGSVHEGRPNLGPTVQVEVYRLMQFTLRDTMIQSIGVAKTDEIFYNAGKKAGLEFYKNIVVSAVDINQFVLRLQESLKELGIGILRIEEADLEAMHFVLTVSEDLDCSGMPVCDEEICVYDEGFIAGLLLGFTGKDFKVKEVDCWCSGDRVCRFDINPVSIQYA